MVQRAVHAALNAAALGFDGTARLPHDPLGKVHELRTEDREVGAHIASALAYGAVAKLREAIDVVFQTLGSDLTGAVREHRPGDFSARRPDFVYRMTRAEDVDDLLTGLSGLLRTHGTLSDAFAAGDDGTGDVVAALTAYVHALRSHMRAERRGARYLTPNPASGSATKRWHLMLRWLVRDDDGVDLGLWSQVDPARLILPLDTHVARLVRALGLTARRSADLKMAREATAALRIFAPEDPLRFDMPLCHLGISRACTYERTDACESCPLFGVCVWTQPERPK